MKIGIVTIYDAFNYGSYLQAYAMQRILEGMGHDVSILDCSRKKYKTIKRIATRRPSRVKWKLMQYCAYRKAWKELNIIKHTNQEYDLVVIGSDEVWNIKNLSFEHCPEYFGYNLNSKKIIAYAPSCGFSTERDLLADEVYKHGIKQIDTILARDDITQDICQKIREEKCNKVVDPTLLYLDRWADETKPYTSAKGGYIVYYSYNPNPYMLDYIKRFAQEKQLKIIAVGFKYDWCDESIVPEPKQFLTMMKNANFVVTTTFHGSIFAVVFKKKFIGFHPNKNPKIYNFLQSIELEKRVHTIGMPYAEFKRIIQDPIDYESIHGKIRKMAKESLSFLGSELGECLFSRS